MKLKKTPLIFYLILQFMLFIGFLFFPLFSVENFFFFSQDKNIINILIALFKNNEMFLFFILFIGTILIPSLKFILSILVHLSKSSNLTKKLLYFCTKWSMLDLLLIALAVTVFKLSYFTEMSVEIGSYFLCGFVIFSIIFEETGD
jgi:paraquat-inducible protein A|tara:strand:+ start:402 stop:839 length:438 start_codon:yes stop_codon:yes gene_type:complete